MLDTKKVERAFLPFALPDIGEEEIAEVCAALRSGWITTGPRARAFEEDFNAFLGGGLHAIAVNSATAGLHLALEAVGIGPGDEVITTPYTFTASAEVLRYLGAHPVFVDIDEATLNIDPSRIASAITSKTRAILPVHFAGLPADMAAIGSLAQQRELRVIEDAAHAFPAYVGNQLIGTLDTDATVFSFYATKTITTGEGGMVVTRNAALADRCRVMRLHGISRDAFDRYAGASASWYYEVVAPGFKYNLTDVAAAIGIHQLRKATRFRERRRAMALRYDDAFGDLPLMTPPMGRNAIDHAHHLYVVRLTEEAPLARDVFIDRMAALGIGCSVHFIPLHLQPYWRDQYRLSPEDFPAALRVFRQAVSLPMYTRMTDSDQERVIDSVRTLLAG